MDDKTRGEEPGSGPGLDVPLKRDRKQLRGSKPSFFSRTPAAAPPAAPETTPHQPELREPGLPGPDAHESEPHQDELTPAEQLFAGQWRPSVPPAAMPASMIPSEAPSIPHAMDPHHGDVDLTEEAELPQADATTIPGPARATVTTPFQRDHSPTVPYVPPGGFTGPGHPRLGPLAPVPPQSRPGLRALDIAAFAAAFVLPPVGLITAVVAILRGKKVRGWASDLARAAISVSLVMTVVFAGVGASIWVTETEKAEQLAAVKAEQRAHDRVEAASAPFCEVLAANPTLYSTADPDYGWPAIDAEGGYNAAIAAYSAVWAHVAEVAPAGIAEETTAISARVAGVVSIANALGASNRAGDLLGLHEKDDLATVESWYVEYCNAPEIPAE